MSKRNVLVGGPEDGEWPLEVKLAIVKSRLEGKATVPELAKAYGAIESTIYGWVARYRQLGEAGLRKMRPRRAPSAPDPVEEKLAPEILETKKQFGWFGIPRIAQWLRRTKHLPVTEHQVRKTLKKAELVPERPRKRKRREAVRFFERSVPNQLWQTDITYWTGARGQKLYLIGFMDDYSRYIVGWGLFHSQTGEHVMEVLQKSIGQYGAPKEILSDQGRQYYSWRGRSPFQKFLSREGIQHIVSQAHHPQTKGKIEAFWKHVKAEFLDRVVAGSIDDLRERLRLWIESYYNFQRPHQGIGGSAPADRYFKVADAVKAQIEKGVRENAERLALGKEPVKPFFLAGRMGDQAVVIRQEGSDVVVNVGDKELEKLRLMEEGHAQTAKPGGDAGGGESGGEGAGAGGAADALGREVRLGDLPGDRPADDPVLQARGAAPQGDGDGGRGEPRAGAPAQPAPGVEGPGGAQPTAPAGGPPIAGDAPVQPEAVQDRRPGKEARPEEGKAAEGGGSPESGSSSGDGADR
ncbi:MAG: IS3 family transposase [Planctomycetia bacterium]|nr:IS3 family transposase [Planctomycetia bacterium]